MNADTKWRLNAIVDEIFLPWAREELPGHVQIRLWRDLGSQASHLQLTTYLGRYCYFAQQRIEFERLARLSSQQFIHYVQDVCAWLVYRVHFEIVYDRGGYC